MNTVDTTVNDESVVLRKHVPIWDRVFYAVMGMAFECLLVAIVSGVFFSGNLTVSSSFAQVSLIVWGSILCCPICLKVLQSCEAERTVACIRVEIAFVVSVYSSDLPVAEILPKEKPAGIVFNDVEIQSYTLEKENGEPFMSGVLRFFFHVSDEELVRLWQDLTRQEGAGPISEHNRERPGVR